MAILLAMSAPAGPYYGRDLALVHHRGFGAHASGCADGMLALLEPVRRSRGLVLELGCGSGLLTRYLVEAGHRVVASDASSAMLDLARSVVSDADELCRLVLPDDHLPAADAVVSVGHALSYLADEDAIDRSLVAIAEALRPGGILAVDICDLRWAALRGDQPTVGSVGEDWAVITESTVPAPNRYVRDITTFVRVEDGSWRRGHERHENVLIDTSGVPELLARHGVDVTVVSTIGSYQLPAGLVAIIGRRRP
ncbi:MAG: methyltransferase domain-containing protein [Egibacteraceae bacterium]